LNAGAPGRFKWRGVAEAAGDARHCREHHAPYAERETRQEELGLSGARRQPTM
jgi:hypothetical protein